MAVENFVLEENHRIWIADRGFQQPLRIRSCRRSDHFQAGDVRVPCRIILAVLGGHARGCAIRPPKHDLAAHLTARHIEGLRCRIDELIHRLHGEIEGHEFDNGLEAGERGTDAEASKAMFGNRRVDHALGTKLLQQPLGHLVCTLILGDLFAHDEDIFVATHFLRHCVAQGLAHGHGDHLGAFRDVGVVRHLRHRGGRLHRFWRGHILCLCLRSAWAFAGGATPRLSAAAPALTT